MPGTGEAPTLRADATAIFHAAVAAVEPIRLVERYLGAYPIGGRGAVMIVGGGKAAARMALGCRSALGNRATGQVITADGCAVAIEGVDVALAGHPLPDERGQVATAALLRLLESHHAGAIVAVISGGASSLMVAPRPPVTLADKIVTTRLLLESGASIDDVNTVRKHLSRVKGGGLLRAAHAPIRSLLISDVVGDHPATIGSGPALPDPTTYADAWNVLERHALCARVPARVRHLIESGVRGAAVETVKAGDREAQGSEAVVLGNNQLALEGAAAMARRRGWRTEVETEPIVGDTVAAARAFGARVRARRVTAEERVCVLAGGETTVRVSGAGRGGRNQHFALALAPALAGHAITVLSAGTDGIDGPTDAAGAFVDGTTLAQAQRQRLDPTAALAATDSYAFFSALGALFRCGPTGTNVMDIKIALLQGMAERRDSS